MTSNASAAALEQSEDGSTTTRNITTESQQSHPNATPSVTNSALERNHVVRQEDMRSAGMVEERASTGPVSMPTSMASGNVPQRSNTVTIDIEPAPAVSVATSTTTAAGRVGLGSVATSSSQSTFRRRGRSNDSISGMESRSTTPRPITSIRLHIRSSFKSILSGFTHRNDDIDDSSTMPMPIMPYETRRAKYFHLAVMVFCLVISLIITLTCGQGPLGMGVTSLMYNKAIQNHQMKVETNLYQKSSMTAMTGSGFESNMADVGEPLDFMLGGGAPTRGARNVVFWFVPKSGAKQLGFFFFECLGLVEASNIGSDDVEEELYVKQDASHTFYVNVDTTTQEGITRAKNLDLVPLQIANVIGTPLIYDIVQLFSPSHRGRFCTLLRNPIDRSLALYNDWKLRLKDPTL